MWPSFLHLPSWGEDFLQGSRRVLAACVYRGGDKRAREGEGQQRGPPFGSLGGSGQGNETLRLHPGESWAWPDGPLWLLPGPWPRLQVFLPWLLIHP